MWKPAWGDRKGENAEHTLIAPESNEAVQQESHNHVERESSTWMSYTEESSSTNSYQTAGLATNSTLSLFPT